MRTILLSLILFFCAAVLVPRAFADTVRLSSTIGPVDAGIIPLLAETYSKATGTEITYEKAGTGATLNRARNGGFDMVVVHARALEEQFIAEGYGQNRRDIMYNDFVVLGPEDDPAKIRGMKSAPAALAKIAAAGAPFVSRGDMSGTHVAETNVWKAAGVVPDAEKDGWYTVFSLGHLGNGPSTDFADKRGAYIVMDRTTYLTKKKNLKIVPLVEGDPVLLNLIAAIEVSPAKFPQANNKGARAFTDWLCSEQAQQIIREFKVKEYGEPLFFPNSDEWNRNHPR